MTPKEKKFIDHWTVARKNWNWGKNFKRTVLHFVLPLVILLDLINFFIIGDVSYGFISLRHLWRIGLNFVALSLVVGFTYNLIVWNTNEMRYWSIMKKNKSNHDR